MKAQPAQAKSRHLLKYINKQAPKTFVAVHDALNIIGEGMHGRSWGAGRAWRLLPYRVMGERTLARDVYSPLSKNLTAKKVAYRGRHYLTVGRTFAASCRVLFDAINSGKATAFGWDGKGPPRPFDIKSLPYWLDDLRLVLFAGVVRDPETWPKRSMLYVVLKQAQIARLLRAKKSKKKRTELCEFEIDGLVTLIEEFAEEHGTLIPFEPLWDLLRPHLSRHMGRDLFNTSIYMKLRCALPTGGGGRRKKSVVVGFHNSREELRELVGKFINTPFLAE